MFYSRWLPSGNGLRRPTHRLKTFALAAAVLPLAGGCSQEELIRKARQDPNSLLVVDCKLPPQVRNVGLAMNYIAPAQAIKTTAIDCGIRGGEYVAYDRANYATALNVWLAGAQAGDPEAQTNVGEIYDKGLGIAPDHAEAARWYQKAASAGNRRAQMNLGYLYERGLGVPRNPVTALNWYRKGAGLTEDLALASTFKVESEPQAGRAEQDATALRGELAQSRREVEDLRRRLGSAQSELDSNREQLRAALKKLEDERSAVEKLKRTPPEQQQHLPKYEQEIRSRQAALDRESENVRQLESKYQRENAALQAKLKAAEQRAVSLNSQLDRNRFETARLQTQLNQTETTLERLRSDYRAQQSAARPATGADDKLKALEADLSMRERELQAQRAKANALEDEVSRLSREKQAVEQRAGTQSPVRDQDLQAVSAQLAAAKEKQRDLDQRTAELERQNASLTTERDRLQAEKNALLQARPPAKPDDAVLAQHRKKLASLEAQLAQREQELQSQRLRSAALQDEAARLFQEKNALEQQAGAQSGLKDQSLQAVSRQLTAAMVKQQEERKKTAELEAQNAKLLGEKSQLMAAAQETDTQRSAQLDRLSRQIGEYENEKSRLEAELKAARAESTPGPTAAGPSDAPRIVLQDPSIPVTRDTGTPIVTLREAVSARKLTGNVYAPAGIQSLTVNDRSEPVNEAGVFTTEVGLTGKDTPVNITLIDKQGRKDALDFRLRVPGASAGEAGPEAGALPPDMEFGNYHALVIGNNRYAQLPALATPINDASAVGGVLRQKYRFTVTQLNNATRYDILSALNKLRDTLKEKDNLLIYYAGHGELDKVNQQGQWLPVDAEQNNTANWIPTDAVTALLNQIAAKHILVVADSCYSGAMTRTSFASLKTGVSKDLKVKWVKKMLDNKSRTVLTSGGLAPVLESGAGGHSIFAQAFIDALQRNADIVQGQDLFRMIADRVKQAAERYRFEQIPQYAPIRYTDHEGSDFFFVPTARG